jgi:hypothetical protein
MYLVEKTTQFSYINKYTIFKREAVKIEQTQ